MLNTIFLFLDKPNEPILMLVFGIAVIIMLLLDLGVFNKNAHKVGNREAIIWSSVWISLALVFAAIVYIYVGKEDGADFLSAYLIEKALSMDNIFVFILLFGYFKVPAIYQHKVLFYGIIGAIVFRAIFIFAGLGMIQITYLPEFNLFGHIVHLNGVLTVFGIFLVYAGISTFKKDNNQEQDFSKNWMVRLIRSILPVSHKYDGGKFFTIENGKRMATPLLLVVAVVEGTDIIFAVDSIPAIFAITNDPFILYTSNVFAILGLRALYFLLANFMPMFRFLHYGLAIILTFIGIKMLLADFVHIPSPVSLSIVAGILVISVLASVIISQRIDEEPAKKHD